MFLILKKLASFGEGKIIGIYEIENEINSNYDFICKEKTDFLILNI